MTCTEKEAQRYAIGKVRISAVTMDKTLRLLDQQVQKRQSAYVCVSNVRTTLLSQKDESYCQIQNDSFLSVPDGMPLVWFARLAGVTGVERTTGADLMIRILEDSDRNGYSHYFLGDTELTLRRMLRTIRDRYPRITVKGSFSPPFRELTDNNLNDIGEKINHLNPSFVWVGLGAPKQERIMARLVSQLDSSVLVGVGAAFRFFVGEYKHPPRVVQICGLEGLYWRFGKKSPVWLIWWYCNSLFTFSVLVLKMFIKRLIRCM